MLRLLWAASGVHRGVLLALLTGAVALGVGWVATPPRLRFSWTDRGATLLAFSPDSRLILTDGDSGGTLRETRTGRVRAKLSPGTREVREPTTTGLHHPSFSADGRLMVVEVGGADERVGPIGRPGWSNYVRTGDEGNYGTDARLSAWDTESGHEVASFGTVGRGDVQAHHSLSADGATLAYAHESAGPNQAVRIWDFARRRVVAEFPGMPPLALSGDAKMVAVADREPGWRRVLLRDVAGRKPNLSIEPIFGTSNLSSSKVGLPI